MRTRHAHQVQAVAHCAWMQGCGTSVTCGALRASVPSDTCSTATASILVTRSLLSCRMCAEQYNVLVDMVLQGVQRSSACQSSMCNSVMARTCAALWPGAPCACNKTACLCCQSYASTLLTSIMKGALAWCVPTSAALCSLAASCTSETCMPHNLSCRSTRIRFAHCRDLGTTGMINMQSMLSNIYCQDMTSPHACAGASRSFSSLHSQDRN